MRLILTLVLILANFSGLLAQDISSNFAWDAYKAFKVKQNIERDLYVEIDTIYTLQMNDKLRVYIDYTVHNNSDHPINKIGFRLLLVNKEDVMVGEFDVVLFSTINAGNTALLKKTITLKDFEFVDLTDVVHKIVLLEDAFIQLEDTQGFAMRHIEF